MHIYINKISYKNSVPCLSANECEHSKVLTLVLFSICLFISFCKKQEAVLYLLLIIHSKLNFFSASTHLHIFSTFVINL